MYEFIVFDLDGTLLNTLEDLTDAVNVALSKNSLQERSLQEVRSFIGNGIKKLIERAVGEENQAIAEKALRDFKDYYGEHCADKTRPYEGIIPLLQVLKKKGKKLAVLSNKADFAVKLLATEYFDGIFDEAVGENESDGIRKKPAPDSLLSVMERQGNTRNNTLYVGDSEVDIKTARNAGVDCLCVTWGFKDKAFLVDNGGKYFVEEPIQILHFIEERK